MISIGIEFSTQSVKTVVLDLELKKVVFSDTFDYDSHFPEYGTVGGVLPLPSPETRHTSPFLLLKAIDNCFDRLTSGGVDLSRTRAIKIDAMQHCTVYTNPLFTRHIADLDPNRSLCDQLSTVFSRQTCPIWEDRTPVKAMEYLTQTFLPRGGIEQLTGNKAELRFPAAQILHWAVASPEEYEQTSDIFLLSAFITSILIGKKAPVDTGDGWGTNLNHLDIEHPGWCPEVLATIESWLKEQGVHFPLVEKLGEMVSYDTQTGIIHPYFSKKYGVHSQTVVLAGTGDNPAALLGCGGHLVVSLGSSYTVMGTMSEIRPSLEAEFNMFGYAEDQALALSVMTNGAKVHDHFYRSFFPKANGHHLPEMDWAAYVKRVGPLQLNDKEPLILPYLFDESTPLKPKGIVRDHLSETDMNGNIRALHLSQVLSLKAHSGHLGTVKKLCMVGGAASNQVMKQWIADVFNAETYSIKNASLAAPLGCAISGAINALGMTYEDALKAFVEIDIASTCRPNPQNNDVTKRLLERYRILENSV